MINLSPRPRRPAGYQAGGGGQHTSTRRVAYVRASVYAGRDAPGEEPFIKISLRRDYPRLLGVTNSAVAFVVSRIAAREGSAAWGRLLSTRRMREDARMRGWIINFRGFKSRTGKRRQ